MAENNKTEKPTPKADWKLDDGRMYSELSATERIRYRQNESETEKSARISSESEVAKIERQQYEVSLAKQQSVSLQKHRQDATQEEIDSQTAKYQREEQQRKNALIPVSGNTQAPVVASMYGDKNSLEVAKITNSEYGKFIDNKIDYIKSLFTRDKGDEVNHFGLQTEKPENIQDANKIGTDFWSSVGDFFKGVVESVKNDDIAADNRF